MCELIAKFVCDEMNIRRCIKKSIAVQPQRGFAVPVVFCQCNNIFPPLILFQRLAENSKVQSNVKYHADFEATKGYQSLVD